MIDKTALVHAFETQQAICACSLTPEKRAPVRPASFWELSRGYFTPPRSAAQQADALDSTAENLRRLVEGKPLPSVVDSPPGR